MKEFSGEICARLATVRLQHFGPRGKSRFARELGIQPSSYNHYEQDRTPPAEILVLAAKKTGTSLVWLLTGQGEMIDRRSVTADGDVEELVDRMRQILRRKPGLKRSATDLIELMELSGEPPLESASRPVRLSTISPSELVPVVGSTAAGPARFWEELESTAGGPEADARLERLLQNQSERSVRSVDVVTASPGSAADRPVSLIQLAEPDELGFVEFLACANVRAKHPKAVAWRIDGDSMAPRYRDGDLVITSPDEPAVEGHPCVARQRGQIGVNCKIFHRVGGQITLIPVNESSTTQQFDAAELLWVHRVLFSVRLSGLR